MNEELPVSDIIKAALEMQDELEAEKHRSLTKDPERLARRRAALQAAYVRWLFWRQTVAQSG